MPISRAGTIDAIGQVFAWQALGAGREQVQVRPVEWDEQTGERRGMFAEFRIDSGMIGNRSCICAGKSAIKRLWIMAGSTLVCLLASQPSCDC